MTGYRTFWAVCGLYFLTLGLTSASGMEFLKWLARTFEDFGSKLNINRIPLYHFPDIWLNLIWCSGLLKIVLGVMVVISVTNEYSYRTIRQNIIDGLSRGQFVASKILTNLLLSFLSIALITVIGLVTGLIYSPETTFDRVITDTEFLPLYFLEVFFFLSFAMMLGFLINRAGLTIIVLLLSRVIEAVITANLDDYVPWLIPYFPLQSISNMIPWPAPRYAFQEIQDWIDPVSVAIVLGWTILLNWLSYVKLKRSDI
jgi:ABC-type transport system involved in multi-copper enzyme maturation permease subunit